MSCREDEWLWGWDETPGIVSVWAEPTGHAFVWRRHPTEGLVRETACFRPWLVLRDLEDLAHLGTRLQREEDARRRGGFGFEELAGEGELRFLVSADDFRALRAAVLFGAARRLGGRPLQRLSELGQRAVLAIAPEEQYLVASGRNYFRGLHFDDLHRLQFDLETTGLDPESDRVFMIALRSPAGTNEILEASGPGDAPEAALLRRFAERVQALDPDVIENHNLHGFDLPFVLRRAEILGLSLDFGRLPGARVGKRAAARGVSDEFARRGEAPGFRRFRYTIAGRELIDSMDAVRRYDFSARDLPGHGLKVVAKHFGLATPTREYIPGARVYETFLRDPARVRRYAGDDVEEAAGVARVLGGAAFALARMAPRRYERLADAGAATGVLDPLLVRAYLRARTALPAHRAGDGTQHTGAALHLFATGVAQRIVKADVASLYPSLMRQYRIGPARDELGAFVSMVERLTDQRLAAKHRAALSAPGSVERHLAEALSAAMKIVINSAYGYLGAAELTRFADVHAANEVTRRGRETLDVICRELSRRGVTLLEADTDGVYFSVPHSYSEEDERRVVGEVSALLSEHVQLEFEGRYAAMLSHEPKNYALLSYDGELKLRGVAFRSSRAEPFGEAFLRAALGSLLREDVQGARDAYVRTYRALQRRELGTDQVTSRVRLAKTPEEYGATRGERRELAYEALLQNGVRSWRVGQRIRVYRARGGRAGLWPESEEGPATDPRDYDTRYYQRLLRETYAARLARALSSTHFEALIEEPDQLSLFTPRLDLARPILTLRAAPMVVFEGEADAPAAAEPLG